MALKKPQKSRPARKGPPASLLHKLGIDRESLPRVPKKQEQEQSASQENDEKRPISHPSPLSPRVTKQQQQQGRPPPASYPSFYYDSSDDSSAESSYNSEKKEEEEEGFVSHLMQAMLLEQLLGSGSGRFGPGHPSSFDQDQDGGPNGSNRGGSGSRGGGGGGGGEGKSEQEMNAVADSEQSLRKLHWAERERESRGRFEELLE